MEEKRKVIESKKFVVQDLSSLLRLFYGREYKLSQSEKYIILSRDNIKLKIEADSMEKLLEVSLSPCLLIREISRISKLSEDGTVGEILLTTLIIHRVKTIPPKIYSLNISIATSCYRVKSGRTLVTEIPFKSMELEDIFHTISFVNMNSFVSGVNISRARSSEKTLTLQQFAESH